MRRILLAAVTLVLPCSAWAESPAERAARWRASLVSPCCWTESLETHGSEATVEARARLDSLLAAGSSDEEIRAAFLDAYGPAVFMTPSGERAVWLFTMPAMFTLLGFVVAVLFLLKLRRASVATAPDTGLPEVLIDDADLGW